MLRDVPLDCSFLILAVQKKRNRANIGFNSVTGHEVPKMTGRRYIDFVSALEAVGKGNAGSTRLSQ